MPTGDGGYRTKLPLFRGKGYEGSLFRHGQLQVLLIEGDEAGIT